MCELILRNTYTGWLKLKYPTVSIIGSCSVNCLMMALISVSLLYWHIGILINFSVYGGLILYQIASTWEMAPDKVACCHQPFSIVIRDLIAQLTDLHVGCNIGGLFINVLAYADDIVLIAPSWKALQQLLSNSS